jgi:hypothetical protein
MIRSLTACTRPPRPFGPRRPSWQVASGLIWLLATGTVAFGADGFSGRLTKDTTWRAADSPHLLTGTVIVDAGATLTLEPGTTVQLSPDVDMVVTNASRLLAEGTAEAPIRFVRLPNTRKRWGGIVIAGAPGSPESRIRHAFIQGNNFTAVYSSHGTLWLEHVAFATRDRQYISLDYSSFVISHCHFPTTTGEFEPLHGVGGVKQGGHGIFRDCFFGGSDGYSDIIDFTGGNRDKGEPIVEFYNNVFVASSDDEIDLDGTDAWIEGNIFLHAHKNGAPDTSSAISGGDHGRDTSQVTIVGNLFFDCDQAVTAKEGNFFALFNNTIVHMTKNGGLDTADGAICVQDLDPSPTTWGEGCYLEGNIIVDVTQLVRNDATNETRVIFNHNLLPMAWTGPGDGNHVGDPKLKHVPALTETVFTNWAAAQVLRDWFSLADGSPARGAGPNGRDLGGVMPKGVWLAGEPKSVTDQACATLTVGPSRAGSDIPRAGWPQGCGYTHYKWRLDGGTWSAETAIQKPIELTGLSDGEHYVEVIGRRDSGRYQNDPLLGEDAVVTRSRMWTVRAKR